MKANPDFVERLQLFGEHDVEFLVIRAAPAADIVWSPVESRGRRLVRALRRDVVGQARAGRVARRSGHLGQGLEQRFLSRD